ncbi:MAG: AAA family ATPase [Janthinobacterium lividum]
MPVRFARLRIAGFKSFAEPVSVEILPGLTGIVGPNGCGKSNVVEALRWGMGESSARSLRGGEMDDLIFAGTASRPARNLAEVVLTLEEATGLAPPPFHEQHELQISRRIERGSGSFYRVNGREARARDVQTLFADLASGARSSAMVSQGRVSAIVSARPEERRSILEEAAGITGLHARRHEAELKLRATDGNMVRVEDLRLQLDARVQALSEQAQQAGRYREVGTQLRTAETTLLALLHARAAQAVIEAGAARIATRSALDEAGHHLARAVSTEQEAEAAVPVLREAEAETRSLAERRRIEADTAAQEGERARRDAEQADARLGHAVRDRDEAAARLADARDALSRLTTERDALDEAAASLPGRRDAEEARLVRLREQVQTAEHAVQATADAAASAQTARAESVRDQAGADARLSRAQAVLRQIDQDRAQAQALLPDPTQLQAHEQACIDAAHALETAGEALEAAQAAHAGASRAADAARIEAAESRRLHQVASQSVQEAETRATRLSAEHAALALRLQQAEAGMLPLAELEAASRAVAIADRARTDAVAALENAEAARAASVSARIETGAQVQEAGRQRSQIETALRQAETAHAGAVIQHDTVSHDHAKALAAIPPAELLATAQRARAAADTGLAAVQARLADADAAHEAANAAARDSAAALSGHRDAHGRLGAEMDGLAQALSVGDDHGAAWDPAWKTLADALDVPDGLEAALAAFLSDGLEAACEADAPRAWLDLPTLNLEALPSGAVALDTLVAAPPRLGRALSRAGLIDSTDDAAARQAELRPGQCLVTRDGGLWRWDGYRTVPGLASQAALRLQLRSRLRETRARHHDAEAAIAPAEQEAARCAAESDASLCEARSARTARAVAEQVLDRTRNDEAQAGRRDAEARVRRDALTPHLARTVAARDDAERALQAAHAALDALADAATLARTHAASVQRETDAMAAEDQARSARRTVEARLQQARADASDRLGRHAESENASAALAPLLERTRDESEAATARVGAMRDTFAGLAAPDVGDLALRGALDRAMSADRTEQAARTQRRTAETSLASSLAERDQLTTAFRDGRSRLDALAVRHEAALAEQDEVTRLARSLAEAAALLADPVEATAQASAAREKLGAIRAEEREAAEARATLGAEQAGHDARRGPLEAGIADWLARGTTAEASLGSVDARLADATAEQSLRAAGPAEAEARAQALDAAGRLAAEAHRAAQDQLEQADVALHEAQLERRAREAGLVDARESVLRADARQEQAQAILAQILVETPEPPDFVPADLSDSAETSLRRRIARLTRERDEIGPVNLRAELELQSAVERIAVIEHEALEIEEAVNHLRGQIDQLNRDGRARLLAVFETVDKHFQALFARMFNGGRAHLGMVGSDDPLSAGLEIYAQPPGKKLATLSLLSGGEQALTALSLIFAVFRCNPAPVCVLDEVDAPLDDANVDRFCALLGDMVQETGTRFLVVTHHQLTMAHMDRLYGVTMQERGVSRVLSVDLARATEMVG